MARDLAQTHDGGELGAFPHHGLGGAGATRHGPAHNVSSNLFEFCLFRIRNSRL
jgi:hypothetical protein